jgi:hypothetical protein
MVFKYEPSEKGLNAKAASNLDRGMLLCTLQILQPAVAQSGQSITIRCCEVKEIMGTEALPSF